MRRYLLHLTVLERLFTALPENEGYTSFLMCLLDEVYSDESVQRGVSCVGRISFWFGRPNDPYEVGDYEIDMTDAVLHGPINPGDITTVGAGMYRGAKIFRGDYKNAFGSRENINPSNRPWIDVYEGDSFLERLYPLGDTYFKYPERPLVNRGYEELLILENARLPEKNWRTSFVISFCLTGHLPPAPPPPISPEQRIGIRGM